MYKICLAGILLVLSWVPQQSRGEKINHLRFPKEIVYLSSNLDHVAIFSKNRTRFGPPDLTTDPRWPSSRARYFEANGGVLCLSIGSETNSSEYAVKRPMKLGEEYTCSRTSFRVAECFDDCKAAIIEMNRPLSGNRSGTYKSSMYVDNCRGVIILGEASNLAEGIPLNAEWLRGEVGILADPAYPNCQSF